MTISDSDPRLSVANRKQADKRSSLHHSWKAVGNTMRTCVRPPLVAFRSFLTRTTPTPHIPIRRTWSIGIYTGTTPLSLHAPAELSNPVLTYADISDVQARFIADPFMIRKQGTWYMFFEVMRQTTRRGEIGLAISEDAFHWKYQRIVLREPFHLSYPYVFEWKGEYFMVPECNASGSVCLYKATAFPYEWVFQQTLVEGGTFLDPSLLHYEGRWWLFVETNPQYQCDTLRLFYADILTGPWQEHPKSPIVSGNKHIARPAGRVQLIGGSILRFAQNCFPSYGTDVRAFVISELTARGYKERECQKGPILLPARTGWNRSGMHHVDVHCLGDSTWVACVDGCTIE